MKELCRGVKTNISNNNKLFTIMVKRQLTGLIICFFAMFFALILDIAPDAAAAPPRRVDAVKVADEMPEFPGGQEAFEKYINEHINFPTSELLLPSYVGAKIQIRLIVMSDGSIGPHMIFLDSTRNVTFNELHKAIEELPKFKPGKVGGKPVNVQITFPVTVNPPAKEE